MFGRDLSVADKHLLRSLPAKHAKHTKRNNEKYLIFSVFSVFSGQIWLGVLYQKEKTK